MIRQRRAVSRLYVLVRRRFFAALRMTAPGFLLNEWRTLQRHLTTTQFYSCIRGRNSWTAVRRGTSPCTSIPNRRSLTSFAIATYGWILCAKRLTDREPQPSLACALIIHLRTSKRTSADEGVLEGSFHSGYATWFPLALIRESRYNRTRSFAGRHMEVCMVGRESDQRAAWVVVLVLLAASIAAPLNQFKVPPVMPLLMDDFHLSLAEGGSLMSLFALTGLFLALPAGFIAQKLGYKTVGLLAVCSVALGAALGALSRDTSLLLLSRVVEGTGTSLIAVVAPGVIAMWFVADKRGAPMGVWATWVPLGQALMFVAAPSLVGFGGWRTVWWFGCLYAVVSGFLFTVFVKPAPVKPSEGAGPGPEGPVTWRDLARVLRVRDLWLISLAFFCLNAASLGFITWVPTFMETAYGTPLSRSSLVISLSTTATMLVIPFSGWLSDRIGSRKIICVVPLLAMAVTWPLLLLDGELIVFVVVVLVGLSARFVPTGVFSGGTEVVGDPRLGGMSMAVIQVGQNAGMLMGPLAMGWLAEVTGYWPFAFAVAIPTCILGAIAAWLARIR
jgi:MFS family permease